MTDIVISATDLVKSFGDLTAINCINLQVPKRTIYGFLGPNGCGKSTTIRVLTGLLHPTSGQVNVLGHRIPEESEQLRLKIGYITQKFSLYDDLTVKENLMFMGRLYGLSGTPFRQRLNEQLSTYDLTRQQHQRVAGMSGGQKQRLSLAAATLNNPALLFLDEPTSAVDPESRRAFWSQLFDLSEQGTTILITTHYMDEAERCHRLAIMDKGVIKADGEPEHLMTNLGLHVVEVKTPHLRALKRQLTRHPMIQSATQLGVRLRVMIHHSIKAPVLWLQQQFPQLASVEMNTVRANLEDVFVCATSENTSGQTTL